MKPRLLLSIAEAAEACSISRTTAYRLVATGEWPTVLVGTIQRVPMRDLERWIERMAYSPKAARTGRERRLRKAS